MPDTGPHASGHGQHTAPTPAMGGHAGHLPSSGRALTISGWLTGVYFVVELGIGLWTGSVAVISDAFHTFSAVGGVLVAIVAARLARRPADLARSFGWYRAEVIGALTNGAFLMVMALVVIVMGAMRLRHPMELPTGPMLVAAAGGLVTEFVALYLLYRQQGQDLNVRGAYWHIIQTFVGSLIIIVAALTIRFTGFLAIDPLLGIAFGFVLLWASWGILRELGAPLDGRDTTRRRSCGGRSGTRSARRGARRAPRPRLGADQRPLRVLGAPALRCDHSRGRRPAGPGTRSPARPVRLLLRHAAGRDDVPRRSGRSRDRHHVSGTFGLARSSH